MKFKKSAKKMIFDMSFELILESNYSYKCGS